ncbi:hypothetical protein MMC10_008068 [Thelotrema lepadinum]|nr:hypothetical protein [Thelotrema lepadinum]
MAQGHHGINPVSPRPDYQTYVSKFGPSQKPPRNFHGIDARRATRFGVTAGMFGVSAGIFAIFFFSEVPRVRIDILQKVPIFGDMFKKEIPPSDNPF